MRILIVGDWHSELHEEAIFNAFLELGHDVFKFAWHSYFESGNRIDAFYKAFQNRFLCGPVIRKLNDDLAKAAQTICPDIIFIYRGTHITNQTLKQLRNLLPSVKLLGYNNDDPFSNGHPGSIWRHFLRAVPTYDLMLAYRHHNLSDFLNIGAQRVALLRSWFFPRRNHPAVLTHEDKTKYQCDVVFVGHYENDGRMQCLEEIVRHGFKLNLFGPGYDWDPVLKTSPELSSLVPVQLVWGEEYNKALCGAKVALCFLSKLNRDTYTRRCFEIPATGTMMLSEFTDDLATLFKEGKEIAFFRSRKELIDKLALYLEDSKLRQEIASNGYQRVLNDGHDVVTRMRGVLALLEK